MEITLGVLIFLVALALAFDFMNGLHDAANSIATVVSTGVLKPHHAVALAAFFNFAALFVFPLTMAYVIVQPVRKLQSPALSTGLACLIVIAAATRAFGIPSPSRAPCERSCWTACVRSRWSRGTSCR